MDARPANDVGGGGAASLTADAIAGLVGGTLRGDGTRRVTGVAPLGRAAAADVSFLADRRYVSQFAASRAGIVLVAPELAEAEGAPDCRIVVDRPHEALLRVLPALYREPPLPAGIHPAAVLGRGVRLGRDVGIGAFTVVGAGVAIGDGVRIDTHCRLYDDVTVGAGSVLFHGVTLYGGTRVGARVRLHAGVRVGVDGFGYVFREGAHQKIPHVGRAIIGDDVEIGANSTVDRGSIDDTVIGAGTRIDNLVHVGHNVRIGRLCLLMAQVGIAGSAQLEDGVIVAGQAGIGGHLTIGAGARIAGQAGVFGDVPAGESWSGYPARPHTQALRAQAATLKLPGLLRTLERLAAREPDER